MHTEQDTVSLAGQSQEEAQECCVLLHECDTSSFAVQQTGMNSIKNKKSVNNSKSTCNNVMKTG
jgi:hypothetical protein